MNTDQFPVDPRAPKPDGYFAAQYFCSEQGPRPAGPCRRVIGHLGEHDDGHGRRWEDSIRQNVIDGLDDFDREFYAALLDFEVSVEPIDTVLASNAHRVAFRLRVRRAAERFLR